eukprot:Em0001g2470a
MMGCFRKKIAFELSVGALYPLQKADDDALQGVTECHSVNEVDGDDDDDDIEIGSPISLNSDIHSDDFLVPDFENPGPDPDDLTALKWGRDHYIRSFPHHLLKRKESESPFTRRSIRQVVKKMEPLIRCFITGRQMSMFKNHIPYIRTLRKENPYWPLETCCDMVHEIELYLMGIQDDVGKNASMTLSEVNKFIVWPETSSDALVVQDHQNIAYLGQTVGNVRQTSSDALVVQDHQNIAYLGQTVGNVRQTSSDALVVQDHQNIAYLGQTVGNVRQTSSDALVVQDHQNIAYLGQTVGNVRQTSSDALVVQDHQNIAYLGQTVG